MLISNKSQTIKATNNNELEAEEENLEPQRLKVKKYHKVFGVVIYRYC